tara:strand:- start:26 stop:367 length:342 start_codon:yes stop_codon:yes gene_type:complete
MKDFKFNYNEESDDLFIYLPEKKSAGAVELGNFIFDFDSNEELVAIEILEASEVLSKLIKKLIELTKIKSIKAEVIKFRNNDALNIEVEFEGGKEKVPIIIPRVREESPALKY